MDPELARTQHDTLAEFYRSQGIKIFYVEHMREDKANALFMRDNILMTPEGAIVGRQAGEVRSVMLPKPWPCRESLSSKPYPEKGSLRRPAVSGSMPGP